LSIAAPENSVSEKWGQICPIASTILLKALPINGEGLPVFGGAEGDHGFGLPAMASHSGKAGGVGVINFI